MLDRVARAIERILNRAEDLFARGLQLALIARVIALRPGDLEGQRSIASLVEQVVNPIRRPALAARPDGSEQSKDEPDAVDAELVEDTEAQPAPSDAPQG